MVIREFYRETKDGVKLYKTYSDSNLYIRKIGTDEVYSVAIDIESSNFKYVETEKQIPEYLEEDLM